MEFNKYFGRITLSIDLNERNFIIISLQSQKPIFGSVYHSLHVKVYTSERLFINLLATFSESLYYKY